MFLPDPKIVDLKITSMLGFKRKETFNKSTMAPPTLSWTLLGASFKTSEIVEDEIVDKFNN